MDDEKTSLVSSTVLWQMTQDIILIKQAHLSFKETFVFTINNTVL